MPCLAHKNHTLACMVCDGQRKMGSIFFPSFFTIYFLTPHQILERTYTKHLSDTLIKNFLISCGIEESKINVYHDKEIKNKASLVREECEKLGIKYNDKIYIVIREFNMPKKYLLPAGAVGNANRIVTLLVQKLEV